MGAYRARSRLRRGGLQRLFILLATFATALNLLVPLTHNAFAKSVGEDAFIEVCTQNGIQKINADQFQGEDEAAAKANSEGFCDACPDCPLCWYGTAAALKDGGLGYPYFSENKPDTRRTHVSPVLIPELHWSRPALRAPPAKA